MEEERQVQVPPTTWARTLARTPHVGPLLVAGYRARIAWDHLLREARLVWRWWRDSREVTNFTYDLTPRNLEQLAAFLAQVTNVELARIETLMRELHEDEALHAHVRRSVLASPDLTHSDASPRFGRRIGWYVLARVLRPRLIVETGVDKGLGACVLSAALLRNAAEGSPGRYLGIDLNRNAGWLLREPWSRVGSIVYGDSLQELARLECIDFLIHDSNHSPEHESAEYRVALPRLAEGALVLSDNAHDCDALWRFARETKRRYAFFAEQPQDHWFPGEGIGLALP
jgi:predicted O-methyltransferase YrrM